MVNNVTEADILQELRKALARDDGDQAITTRELGQELGIGEGAVRHRLRDLMVAGKIKAVKVRRKCILTDTMMTTWGYISI